MTKSLETVEMSLTGAVFQLRKYSQGLKNWMGYSMFWKEKKQ